MSIAAFVLAAGAGSRFEGPVPKLLAPFRGRPMVGWALEAACSAGLDDVYLVVGATDLSSVVPDGVTVIENPDWSQGQASSLAAAVGAAQDDDHDAIVVGLGDQPFIPAEAWSAVAASTAPIAVATYKGRRRNPVRLERSVWSLLPGPDTGDYGARRLMQDRVDLVEEVPCPGNPVDIDTPEDLTRWS